HEPDPKLVQRCGIDGPVIRQLSVGVHNVAVVGIHRGDGTNSLCPVIVPGSGPGNPMVLDDVRVETSEVLDARSVGWQRVLIVVLRNPISDRSRHIRSWIEAPYLQS